MDGTTSTENVRLKIAPGQLSYIYYTSGTTGQPKGIVDCHRNVLHNIMRYTNTLKISPNDRLTLLQSCGFSGAVSSLFCALLNGATSFPFSLHKDGSYRLASWLNQERITIYHSVPSIFRLIAKGKYPYPAMRIIRLEGDQASPRDLVLYKKFFPDSCILVNGLGATEYGLVRQYIVDKKTSIPNSTVPIGYAVEDMEVLILGDSGQRLGENCVGEIAVRSRYLAPGYWCRPELTEEVFSGDTEDQSKRIFRTGDMGRLRADGCLEYLGRKNFQQRLKGRWIEIPQIEKALYDLGIFNDILVTTREDPGYDIRLVAYLVPRNNTIPQTDEIRKYLSGHLPDYMIPAVFMTVESIPLNSFGKVDRRALPAPSQIRPELSEVYVAAQDHLQNQLKQIWEKVLKIRPIGIRDNFFDLGGDSILAAYLFSLLEEQIVGQRLPISTILSAPTIEQLADILGTGGWASSWASLIPIQTVGTRSPFFCVHPHEGNVVGFYDLSKNLGQDQPLYGLQAQGLDGKSVGQCSFENMAAHYLKEIRTVQPRGPYFLGGLCMGGVLALEMAQQLHTLGEKVGLLVLMDAPHPDYPEFLPHTTSLDRIIHRIKDRALMEVTIFTGIETRAKLPYLVDKLRRFLTITQMKSKILLNRYLVGLGLRIDYYPMHTPETLSEAHRKAYKNYRPRPYRGLTVLFRAKKQPRGIIPNPSLDWSGLISNLEIREIPGHPRGLISGPRVQIVAQQLKSLIEQVRK